MKKQIPKDQKEKFLHPIRAPRLEGAVKNAMMNPIRKRRGAWLGKDKKKEII